MKCKTLIAVILLLAVSCKQDFKLTTEYQETTVVYGLLNVQDSLQFVRIQRGYIDTSLSALTLAQNPDSIYYGPSLQAQLYDQTANEFFTLQRIHGEDYGLPKDSGKFANQPNILYKLDQPLDKAHTYQLNVYHPQSGNQVVASTNLVKELTVQLPSDNYVINWPGDEKDIVTFSWKHAAGAGIYDLKATFWYTNYYGSGKSEVAQVSWKVFTNKVVLSEPVDALLRHNYRTVLLYQNIGGRIPEDTKVVGRSADSVTFVMAAGGQELAKLISNQRVRDGILSGMATPYYTNVMGGYGIFSSIYRDSSTSYLGRTTLDSLRYGTYTGDLKFD